MSRQLEIGIIGAGLSGLRCADVLLQHGCKVTIFEARDRIGGRVMQSGHLGHLVDLGPNWIHGRKDNVIRQLAAKTKTTIDPWDEDEVLFDPSGKVVDEEETGEYMSLIWENGLIDEAAKYSKDNLKSIHPQRSLYDFLKERVEGLFQEHPADEAKRRRSLLLKVVSGNWASFVGSPTERQSLRNFWLEEWIDGENVFVAETYQRILKEVAESAEKHAEIMLGTQVEEVDTTGDRPVVKTKHEGSLPFDEVIVTIPLGCLQRGHIAFQPALPTRLSQAISSIGYGTLDKVYITFPSAWWTEEGTPIQSGRLLTAIAQENVDQQPSGETAVHLVDSERIGWFNWVSPKYAQQTNPQQWDAIAMNLAALPEKCAHPTLLFYTSGPCSVHIARMVSEAKSDSDRDTKLVDFFRPYFSLLPGFDASDADCKPTAVLATAWAADELAGYGSYSNFQTGLDDGAEDIEVMRQGMPERHVWLAGEHTAPFESIATTEGAYVSGEAVARRVVESRGLAVVGSVV